MPGVLATLTADEVKQPGPGGMAILSNEPSYVGQPIMAIAAETEQMAADALAAVEVDLEPLPFCLDPLESLKPNGPNALTGVTLPGEVLTSRKSNGAERILRWPETRNCHVVNPP